MIISTAAAPIFSAPRSGATPKIGDGSTGPRSIRCDDLNGLAVEDIGGDSAFVKSENRNRFHRNTADDRDLAPGTLTMLPIRECACDEPGKLWHPLKPAGTRTWGAGRTTLKRHANRVRLIWQWGRFLAGPRR